MHFSYSTLNMLRTSSHGWLNKVAGIEQEDKIYFREGKAGHRIIQDHVSGRKLDPRISYLDLHFPIVETRDFDPKTKFSFEVDGYEIIGFYDGLKPKQWLEIKLSSTTWTIGKYARSPQRWIYAYANPGLESAVLVTGSRNPDDWKQQHLQCMDVPATAHDREKGLEWMREGIKIFESGDFTGGLDEQGYCHDRNCNWGKNCMFRRPL